MTRLLSSIVEISLVSSVIIGLLLLVSPLLERKYTSKSLCFVWLVLALRLIVPLSIHVQQAAITIPAPILSAENEAQTHTIDHVIASGTPSGTPTHPYTLPASGTTRPPLTPYEIAALIWAAGASVFALVQMSGYLLLRRSIRRYSKPIKDAILLEAFRQALVELGIKDGRIAILEYAKAGSPMMTGFFRPAILMPTAVYDAGELALIFRHELTHFKRKHLWFKLLLTLAGVLHWFNPLVWLMVREANRQIENCCDREVVARQDIRTRKKYGETLLAAMAQDHTKHIGLSTYYHGGKKTMKQRLTNIFDQKSKKRGIAVVMTVLLIVLISGSLVACQTKTGAGPQASASPSASVPPASPSAAEASSGISASGPVDTSTPSPEPSTPSAPTPSAAPAPTPTVAPAPAQTTAPLPAQTAAPEPAQSAAPLPTPSAAPAPTPSSMPAPAAPVPKFSFLISLLGMTKADLLSAIGEKPQAVDEGGLGFANTGIRVWFDAKTFTKVAQVLIMTDAIDIDGLRLGDSYKAFKTEFGTPVSDTNGDAHFKYGGVWLSVVRDTSMGKVIAVYILAENF